MAAAWFVVSRQSTPPVAPERWRPLTDDQAVAEAISMLVTWVDGGARWQASSPEVTAAALTFKGRLGFAIAQERKLAAGRYNSRAAVRLAIIHAAQADDLVEIISEMRTSHWLVDVLAERGGYIQARPTLREALAAGIDQRSADAVNWPLALARCAQPEDYPLLAECLARATDGAVQAKLADELSRIPGFPWREAVRAAWRKRPEAEYRDGQQGFAAMAAKAGATAAAMAVVSSRAPAPTVVRVADGALKGVSAQDRAAGATTASSAPAGRGPDAGEGPAAGASRAEVDAWIDACAAALPPDGGTIRSDHPLVARLAALPAEHYPALLAAMGRTRSFTMNRYLELASVRAARPEHRELICAELRRYPHLAAVVVANGWEQDALATARTWLRAGHASGNMDTAEKMLAIVAKAGDAGDHPLLKKTLVECTYGYWQAAYCRQIAQAAGLDLDAAVREAWGHHPPGAYPDGQEGFCLEAARRGVAEALPLVVQSAIRSRARKFADPQLAKDCHAWLRETFDLAAKQDVAAWFAEARSRLAWNAAARRWRDPGIPAEGKPPAF